MPSKKGLSVHAAAELVGRHTAIRITIGITVVAVLFLLLKNLPLAHALGVVALLVLVTLIKPLIGFLDARVDTKLTGEKHPVRGVAAGETVEEILDQLDAGYLVIHDVRCQFGNIDHVLLSKSSGVFLIKTKSDPGRVAVVESKIRVNGHLPESDFVAETLHNTYWLIEELETITGVRPAVTSMIVFPQAFVAQCPPIKGITITDAKSLRRELNGLGQPLAPKVWDAREQIAGLLAGTHQV